MNLKINWTTDGSIHRASLEPGVKLTKQGWKETESMYISQVGFVVINRANGRYRASLYGSVCRETPTEVFYNLADAERYVEQRGTAAIVASLLNQ